MRKDNKKYSFLVVEDNPGDFFLVEEYLEEVMTFPKIQHAKNFKTAEKILKKKDFYFDAILLDITLPDKEHAELIKSVMVLCSNIPIIIFTGYSNLDFAIESLSLGVSDYLLKDDLNSSLLYKSIIYSIERNKNLVNLRESEQRYSNLFHLSPQPMWVYDANSLQFLDVNDAAIEHYGFSKAEFLSMTIKDIRPAEDIPLLEKVLNERAANNESTFRDKFRHLNKFGKVIDVDIHSNRIIYKGVEARIILANDITDRLLYIKAIEEQNARLKEIAWIQSHVVRAPLARIMGLTNMIKTGVVDISKSERNEFLTHILSSADELDEIINDLSNKTEAFNLKESKL